ncbi:hypothetical protein DPEC_G00379030 [Dallia pectoralis]|nr:hypothetical protein DPEC_G00379030 [Dallia pectoralis]
MFRLPPPAPLGDFHTASPMQAPFTTRRPGLAEARLDTAGGDYWGYIFRFQLLLRTGGADGWGSEVTGYAQCANLKRCDLICHFVHWERGRVCCPVPLTAADNIMSPHRFLAGPQSLSVMWTVVVVMLFEIVMGRRRECGIVVKSDKSS